MLSKRFCTVFAVVLVAMMLGTGGLMIRNVRNGRNSGAFVNAVCLLAQGFMLSMQIEFISRARRNSRTATTVRDAKH
jgi:hypothetical protein